MKSLMLFLSILSIIFGHNYHGCALAPDNMHGWVVCLDTTLILHTTDGGTSWQVQNSPDSTVRFFDVTCLDQFSAWACGVHPLFTATIIHTENSGIDWSIQDFGLAKYATRIEFLDRNYGWAACGDGVVGRTVDGGNYWNQILTLWYGAEFYGVSFVNPSDGWLVAGYPDSLYPEQGLILRSTDGGITWDSLYRTSSYEDFFDVHFFNLFDGIVVGGNENDYSPLVLKTSDGGLNWDTIGVPPDAYYLRAVEFVGDEGWAVGRFGTILHTSDGGDTWTFQPNPATNTLFDVDFSDGLHGLACGDGIMLHTTDGGQNWYQTGIEEYDDHTVKLAGLEVFPNPSKEMAKIIVQMPNTKIPMTLKIFDITGRLIKNFSLSPFDLTLPTQVVWDGTNNTGNRVAEGVYFIRFESNNFCKVKKVVLVR